MKTLLPLLLSAIAFAATPAALTNTLTDAEREKAAARYESSQAAFLAAIDGLTDAQWSFKATPSSWSIAECAEHIALTEKAIPELLKTQILLAPPLGEKKRSDDDIIRIMNDRSGKAQSPEQLKPASRFPGRPQLTQFFLAQRKANIEYVKTTGDDLRGHATPHPALGPIDGYQWILFVAAHSERHTAQILEVKAAAGYPK